VVLALLALAGPTSAPASTRRRGSVQALFRLLRSRRAAFGNGLLFIIGIVGGTVSSLMPLLAVQRKGGAAFIAGILALGYLIAAFLNIFLGRLSDRFGRQWPTVVGFAITAALYPLLPLFDSLVALGIVTVLAQSVLAALWTPTAAMISDGAESGPTGQAVGVGAMNAAWAAGGASGPILAAWLADVTGFVWPFVLAGALCAGSAVVLIVGYTRRDKPTSMADAPAAASRR
jgi:MFS family permease